MSDLLDLVELDYEIHERASLPNLRAMRKYIERFFGDRDVQSLTTLDFQRYKLERRRAGAAQSTVNHELSWVSRGYYFAALEGICRGKPHIERFKIGNRNARTDFIELDELEEVLYELPPPVRDLVEFLYFSGWRSGEAKGLLWEHVREAEIVLPAGRTKESRFTGKATCRRIPLKGRLERVIARRRRVRREDCSYVFHRGGRPIKTFAHAWRTACQRAGVKAVPHALRRSFCQMAVDAGVDRDVARSFTGHRTDSTFARYQIAHARRRNEAADRISEYADDRARAGRGGEYGDEVPSQRVPGSRPPR